MTAKQQQQADEITMVEQPSSVNTNTITDKDIRRDVGKLNRMIEAREEDRVELAHEIVQLVAKRDALIETQIQRLRAQINKADNENESEQ